MAGQSRPPKHVAGNGKAMTSPPEFQLLVFIQHQGKSSGAPPCWKRCGTALDPESNVVDVHVGNLRRKLAPRWENSSSRRFAGSVV